MDIIRVENITVGSKIAESDGYMWDVVEIVKETAKTKTIRICSDFSSFEKHWTTRRNGEPGGLIKTFRKSTRLYGRA